MYRAVAIQSARAGGQVLREHFQRGTQVFAKGVDDVVTIADRASETAILSLIRSSFPNHAIFSEEEGVSSADSDYLWVVDPLDGTHNFVLGLPYFSVSVALQHAGQTVLGVVYHPILAGRRVDSTGIWWCRHRLDGASPHVRRLGLSHHLAYWKCAGTSQSSPAACAGFRIALVGRRK